MKRFLHLALSMFGIFTALSLGQLWYEVRFSIWLYLLIVGMLVLTAVGGRYFIQTLYPQLWESYELNTTTGTAIGMLIGGSLPFLILWFFLA